jgi:hypothetical protein
MNNTINAYEADPYGAFIEDTRKALTNALNHEGAMSEHEAETVKIVRDLLKIRDPEIGL